MEAKKKAIIVALFLIIGLAISVYLTYSDLNTAYFLLHGRIFELGIGAALAIFWHSLPTTSKITNTIISILGFCLLFIPAFILDKNNLQLKLSILRSSDSVKDNYYSRYQCIAPLN